MKKILIVVLILIIAIGVISFGNRSINITSENANSVNTTYGTIDGEELTQKEIIEKLKTIDTPRNEMILIDGCEISLRYIQVLELFGRTRKEAIQYTINSFKRDEAMEQIIKKYNIELTSDQEIEDYYQELYSQMTEDDKLKITLMAGFDHFEDYINSPELIESIKSLFAYGVFVKIKTDEMTEKYPEMSFEEVKELGRNEAEKEIMDYMNGK